MPNQRRKYRARPSKQDEIAAAVVRPGRKPVQGQVQDISIDGAAILFESRSESVFALGETVQLDLQSRYLQEPLIAECVVRHRAEAPKGRVYGFQFAHPLQLPPRLPPPLARLFNRRATYRVQPDPTQPIRVNLEGSLFRSTVKATLRDVSPNGISVQAPYAIDNLLMRVELVTASFRLPGVTRPMVFSGNIVHRDLLGGGVCYGILFDQQLTDGFKKKQEALLEYIAERQRVLCPVPT